MDASQLGGRGEGGREKGEGGREKGGRGRGRGILVENNRTHRLRMNIPKETRCDTEGRWW